MRPAITLILLLPALALGSARTVNVTVLSSAATQLPQLAGRVHVEIFNDGPNTIWCSLTEANAAAHKGHPVLTGKSWGLSSGSGVPAVWCRAETADQVVGGLTVLSEMQ